MCIGVVTTMRCGFHGLTGVRVPGGFCQPDAAGVQGHTARFGWRSSGDARTRRRTRTVRSGVGSASLRDSRQGRNTVHRLGGLFRQAVYVAARWLRRRDILLRLNWPEILSRDQFVIFQAREREPCTGKGKPPFRQNCRTNIKYPAGHHSLHPEAKMCAHAFSRVRPLYGNGKSLQAPRGPRM